jgi:hypothetical protein
LHPKRNIYADIPSFFQIKPLKNVAVTETINADGQVESKEEIVYVPAFSALQNSTDQYKLALSLYERSAQMGNTEVFFLKKIFFEAENFSLALFFHFIFC